MSQQTPRHPLLWRRWSCLAAGLTVLSLLLSGCGGFRVKDLAKTDIDYVSDTQQTFLEAWLRELTVKLYKRNPSQLAKSRGATIETRLQLLFDGEGPVIAKELGGASGVAAMQLAFEESFKGDRILALSAGLTDMLRKSYGYRSESFMLDELDADALFKSARNVEALAWRLNHRLGPDGKPLILSNEPDSEIPNLSFERLFGKIVAAQDCIADVAAKRNRRTLSRAAQGVATFVFLPI